MRSSSRLFIGPIRTLPPALLLTFFACSDPGPAPGDVPDSGIDPPTADAAPAGYFHTCGQGGATEEFTTFEVAYPPGTFLYDGTEVTTGRYLVWAPPPREEPYPLIIAMHGDNGNPGATHSDWVHLLDGHEFIFLTILAQTYKPTVHNILDDVGSRYDIDIDRVYATGASAGSWVGGTIFFTMQDIFAAVQLSCGGSTSPQYRDPGDPACKAPTRFEIAPDDFLYFAAEATADFLTARDHEVEFHETECSGHCCGQKEDYGDAAWQFFQMRTLCGTRSPEGCGAIATP